ncbi:phosphotransferase family protein [Halogeometricum luteum]|uniref:Phosphotransferase n=1 Tax=Halogeometricum luteum TaxID=2950537 RepID=A0ABU2FYT9_9EURY|nr:phosphotransferase [Halogeometricum sp. S3BR5-2]MDS0293700.1 phosphotransferase [Halogeometricum sp. S3BR5-2]
MDDVPEAREFSRATLARMLRRVEPNAELRGYARVDRGFGSIYRLDVRDDEGDGERYLKASPDGETRSVPTEPRIQSVLRALTSMPVPTVRGVVDDHGTLPTPYFVMDALPGERVAYERVCRLDDGALRRLARETGEQLGELHSVPAVDAFGLVGHDGPPLTGGRPDGDPATLTVEDACEDWPTFLRGYVGRELDRHADSRFSRLTPTLERWFDAGIGRLDGPFDPVLGRNDHGLHNLLVDPETGEITAVLDWGYTLAVPAAFDFEFAVYLYGGAFLAGLPDVSDRREPVREAMLSGYRATAPERVGRVSTPEPRYEALAMVRIMNDFHHLDVPEGAEGAVTDRIEADVRALLDR